MLHVARILMKLLCRKLLFRFDMYEWPNDRATTANLTAFSLLNEEKNWRLAIRWWFGVWHSNDAAIKMQWNGENRQRKWGNTTHYERRNGIWLVPVRCLCRTTVSPANACAFHGTHVNPFFSIFAARSTHHFFCVVWTVCWRIIKNFHGVLVQVAKA